MGLSLRDLQEALYPLLDSVLSLSAVNLITLQAQQWMEQQRQHPIEPPTPPLLIVDGVWVTILYPSGEWQADRAGHRRQVRRAQDRVESSWQRWRSGPMAAITCSITRWRSRKPRRARRACYSS